MTLFFSIVLSIFLLVVILQYILIRFILPQSISAWAKIVITVFITVSINTIPFLYMSTERTLDQLPWWHREFVVFPYAIFMVASAFSGVLFLIVWHSRSILLRLWPRFEKTKRDFLGNAARAFAATSTGAFAYGTYRENSTPEITRLTLHYGGLHPDLCGLTIVHLTDIHAGPWISFDKIAKIVSMANAMKPDLIVLTGDYVNNNPAYIHGCLGLLDNLEAPAGVYGVYGNHDYYTGIGSMREAFSRTCISMLSDDNRGARGLEGILNIIGVDDPVRGWATDARFRGLANISSLSASEQFNLLLSHRPGIFSVRKEWGADLTLAGHTHGGQVIVPGVGERGFSLARLFLTYTHGLYASDENPEVRMYLSRGIGTIIAPVRLFCKPEIVEITLTN